MKKLLIFSIILIMCFGGCSAAEAAGEYSFSLSDYYPKEGTVFCSYPEIFENKIVFSAARHISDPQQGNNKVKIYDLTTDKETALNISAIYTFITGDKIYYQSGRNICKASLDGGNSEVVFTAPEDKLFGFSKGGSDGRFIFWLSDSDYSNAEIFCYDTAKESYSSVAKPASIHNPYQNFKIKNDFACYAEASGGKYNIYSVKLSTGKNTLLCAAKKDLSQYIYNGNTLVWSDSDGVHYFRNDTVYDIDNGKSKGDVDIFKDRYIFFFNNFQIYVYDIETEQIAFTTAPENYDENKIYPEYCQWFSLDEESGKAVFILWDRDLALSHYSDWEYEEYPELISVMDIKKAE